MRTSVPRLFALSTGAPATGGAVGCRGTGTVPPPLPRWAGCRSSASEPRETFRSTRFFDGMPGTVPVSVYCQIFQPCPARGTAAGSFEPLSYRGCHRT